MKIIHFSKSDDKGAFLAAYRFHKQLLAAGHNSIMLVAKKTKVDKEIIEVKLNLFAKCYVKFFNFITALLVKNKTDQRYHFYNYFERFSYPVSAFENSLPFVPDIFVIHWVTGFINTKNIHGLHKKNDSPVVWRFNDMNAFTGGCHYSNGCTHYFKSCGNCPALYSFRENDRSSKNLAEKIRWLSKTNVVFASSTSEIDEQLRSSAIGTCSNTRFIMLSVNGKFFKPAEDKDAIAISLGLPPGRKIIFFGAQDMNEPRKGFKEFADALRVLKQSLTEDLAKKILLVYSTNAENATFDWPFECTRLPYIKDDERLANSYKAATLLASPSIEDAGPMMLAESMLCGTPVVAFATGLAKDGVINNITGFIVPPGDVNKFALGLQKIIEMDAVQYRLLSNNCFSKAGELFSLQREIAAYEQLFMELLNRRSQYV